MQSVYSKSSNRFVIVMMVVLCVGSFCIGYTLASTEKADCESERERADRFRENYWWAMKQWPSNRD